MSAGERSRLQVIRLVVERKLRQAEAAERLGICVRQVERLVGAWKTQGAAGLVSKRRGRVSPRRAGAELRANIAAHLRAEYSDFGPAPAGGKPAEIENIDVSRETILADADRAWPVETQVPQGQSRARSNGCFNCAAA